MNKLDVGRSACLVIAAIVSQILGRFLDSAPLSAVGYWLSLALALVVVSVFLIAIYDLFLWKLFFPGVNIDGFWRYVNEYDDGRPNTEGVVRIRMSPEGLSLEEGTSGKPFKVGQYEAYWRSVLTDFEDKTGLRFTYEVYRKLDNKTKEVLKRSYAEFTVRKRSRGWPSVLKGPFWNCLRNTEEHAALSGLIPSGWPPSTGTGTYTRISRAEARAWQAQGPATPPAPRPAATAAPKATSAEATEVKPAEGKAAEEPR